MSLVSQLTGKKDLREDVPVPLAVQRQLSGRERGRRSVQRRSAAAAMLGMAEAEDDDESIIPDDAEDVENIAGPSGIKIDDKRTRKDQEPPEPDHPSAIDSDNEEDRLLTPRDALVAPDVTPQAMEPIDASEVPAGREAQTAQVPKFVQPQASRSAVDPMDVLLGRASQLRNQPEPEQVVTAEAAQATVNTILNVGGASGQALLKPREPMPDPTPGDASKIMEAFNKYGPARKWNL